ncbi:MAG: acyl-CoA dehydrogenase family protein [Deltaproteobacteria bacterium]|nr:acyl-CoA dehydrogenase family protein [Deltaproteobacteria bacterium]
MDFELSADQRMIVETAAAFVKKELPLERMRHMREDATGWSRDVWKQMGELGWLGIMHPESVGGFGGSFVDAALILERLGGNLVGEPFAASAVVGAMAMRAGSAEQQERFLAPMIAGDTSLALAWAERAGRFDAHRVATRAEKTSDGYRIRGEKVWVLNGHAADHLVVSARTSGADGAREGVSLFVLDGDAPGVVRKAVKTMDGQRAAMVTLDCTVPSDRLLGDEGGAAEPLERVLDHGAAATIAEGHGVMKAALDMTVEYLKTREQFGVKIGVFQALQHRAVDMFVETELTKSAMLMSAIKVESSDPVERKRAISAAKAQLAMSGRYVSQQSIQLHGGVGVTDEHDIGLYFKRMHVLTTLYGDEEHHLARYASLPLGVPLGV